MRIAIRADASISIGTGHVMRCVALAGALGGQGAEIVFVCREEPGNLCGFLKESNFPVHTLPVHGDLSKAWLDDADATLGVISGAHVDWLIVDHYQLDARWEQRMRAAARKIMVVDDLVDRPHDCDLLLDQNFYPDSDTRYDALVPVECIRLLGPGYGLLRSEFKQARKNVRARDGSVGRILIFFGGSDPTNETAKALDALRLLGRSDIAVDVVVGESNPNRHQIEKQCGALPSVSFHCQVKNMAELMVAADLCIGAGGSTTWERCCLGLPGIIVAIADNQIEVTRALADVGHLLFLGKSCDVTAQSLAHAVSELLNDGAALCAMADKSFRLVDGRGAERVAAYVNAQSPITLRCATLDDEFKQFEWRNAPEIRSASFDDKLISLDEHQRWFRSVLKDPTRHLLIAECADKPIGVLRYDVVENEAEVSIFILSGLAGQGLGARLLQEGSLWLERSLPQIAKVRARILPGNLASRKAFLKAGYVRCGQDYIFDLGSECRPVD